MFRKIFCFILFVLSTTLMAHENQLIYMISTPRSMSTAFLRMMENRGDFSVYNEHAVGVFCQERVPERAHLWFTEQSPSSYQEATERQLEELKHSNVFVKECSFTSHKYLFDDLDFVRNPQVHFVILTRDPHAVAISYHRKFAGATEHIGDLIGHNQLWDLLQYVKKESSNPVQIIFSEDLSKDPKGVVESFCTHYHIPFDEKHLHWKAYDATFDGKKEWHEVKNYDCLMRWHSDTVVSTGFGPLATYEVDELDNPTFSEIEDPESRQRLIEDYLENVQAYQKIKTVAKRE